LVFHTGEDAPHVDVEDVLIIVFGLFGGGNEDIALDTRVVKSGMQAAETADGFFDSGGDGFFAARIALNEMGRAAGGGDSLSYFSAAFSATTGKGDFGACSRIGMYDGLADARGAAGDKGNFVGEIEGMEGSSHGDFLLLLRHATVVMG
jgi:hypothetical protein